MTNESDEAIFIVNSESHTSKIIPKTETQEKAYPTDCIRIESGGEVYEYRPLMPTKKYRKYFVFGTFSTSVYASFTETKDLVLYKENDRKDYVILEKGCAHSSL